MSATGAQILGAADLVITLYERISVLVDTARKEGLITVEEQAARIARVKAIGTEVGVEVIDPPAPPSGNPPPESDQSG